MDAGAPQLTHHWLEHALEEDDVQAALGGELFTALGHQGHPGGLGGNDGLHGLRSGSALHIEGYRQHFLQDPEIPVLDVAAVRPQVHGDPLGASALGQEGRGHGFRFMAAPGLSEGGYMVDVYTEPEGQWKLHELILPSLTTAAMRRWTKEAWVFT